MKHFNLILNTSYFKPITTTYNRNHTNTNMGKRQTTDFEPNYLVNVSGKFRFGSPLKVDAPSFNHSIIHTSTAPGSRYKDPGEKGKKG